MFWTTNAYCASSPVSASASKSQNASTPNKTARAAQWIATRTLLAFVSLTCQRDVPEPAGSRNKPPRPRLRDTLQAMDERQTIHTPAGEVELRRGTPGEVMDLRH